MRPDEYDTEDRRPKEPNTFAPDAEAHLIRMKRIVQQLGGLQRELLALGYPTAGVRLAAAAEQIALDVMDKLHDAGLLDRE